MQHADPTSSYNLTGGMFASVSCPLLCPVPTPHRLCACLPPLQRPALPGEGNRQAWEWHRKVSPSRLQAALPLHGDTLLCAVQESPTGLPASWCPVSSTWHPVAACCICPPPPPSILGATAPWQPEHAPQVQRQRSGRRSPPPPTGLRSWLLRGWAPLHAGCCPPAPSAPSAAARLLPSPLLSPCPCSPHHGRSATTRFAPACPGTPPPSPTACTPSPASCTGCAWGR